MEKEYVYKSGSLNVGFTFEKNEAGRSYYSVYVKSTDGRFSDCLDNGDYHCPSSWNSQKVAEDLVGWMVDLHEEVFDLIEHDIENSVSENKFIVDFVQK